MKDLVHENRPTGPALDRFQHFFDSDGFETEPGSTKPGGHLTRGQVWFTVHPKTLAKEGDEVAQARRVRRVAAVVRRADGTKRFIRQGDSNLNQCQ